MQTAQGLTPVNLAFFDGVLAFQCLQAASPPISTIIFERLTSLQDYPCLSSCGVPDIAAHLCGLFYDCQAANHYPNSSILLEQMLLFALHTDARIFMAECSDMNSQTDFIYLLVHCQDITGLGCYFTGAKVGIFKFSYEELYGSTISGMLGYIKALKNSRTEIIAQYYYIKDALNKKQKDSQLYANYVQKLTQRADAAQKLQESSEEMIKTLQIKVERKKKHTAELQDQDLECLICRSSPKSIVFLPCGHVFACKDCVVEKMKLTLNKIINSRAGSEPCPLCKGRVREVREVSFN
ncbi:unnamed protein product [Blepharisma stoltei]|uniref:RING-type domain-containing protein n=1 Tax=Blepharisma stoltei TaxID=1481888 RepID=A0AAU9JNC7_9CILI|nr:unnamed protein product [Blepharisma stoltei]